MKIADKVDAIYCVLVVVAIVALAFGVKILFDQTYEAGVLRGMNKAMDLMEAQDKQCSEEKEIVAKICRHTEAARTGAWPDEGHKFIWR